MLDNLVKPQMKVLGFQRNKPLMKPQMLAKVSMESHANKLDNELSDKNSVQPFTRAFGDETSIHALWVDYTSALDPEMVSDVLDVMSLSKEITMIVVTHEMGFAKKFGDRVIFMNQGAVEEDNNTESCFTKPNTDRAVQFLKKIRD